MNIEKSRISNSYYATKFSKNIKQMKAHYQLYLFALPAIIYFLIFKYLPMYGVQIAFRDFTPSMGISGIWEAPWAGLKYIQQFVESYHFWALIKNTLAISASILIIAQPIPIIFALLLNEIDNIKFKKTIQTVSYAPHFISMVVMISMMKLFLSPSTGLINNILDKVGYDKIHFMIKGSWFVPLYTLSHIWQHMGYGAIIYIAVLATVNPSLVEAAIIDGANRFQKILYINIPAILPTIVILYLLAIGRVMTVGFEKVFLMQNPANMMSSDVISTYTYRAGLIGGDFSFGAAVGLFNATINFIMLITANKMAKRIGETSLF